MIKQTISLSQQLHINVNKLLTCLSNCTDLSPCLRGDRYPRNCMKARGRRPYGFHLPVYCTALIGNSVVSIPTFVLIWYVDIDLLLCLVRLSKYAWIRTVTFVYKFCTCVGTTILLWKILSIQLFFLIFF